MQRRQESVLTGDGIVLPAGAEDAEFEADGLQAALARLATATRARGCCFSWKRRSRTAGAGHCFSAILRCRANGCGVYPAHMAPPSRPANSMTPCGSVLAHLALARVRSALGAAWPWAPAALTLSVARAGGPRAAITACAMRCWWSPTSPIFPRQSIPRASCP